MREIALPIKEIKKKILLLFLLTFAIVFISIALSCDDNGDGDGDGGEIVFTYGVASGDVRDREAIIWTRVNQEAEIIAQVSIDCTFTRVDKELEGEALAQNDFIVKLTVSGLEPDQTYCYRFLGSDVGDVGEFRTAPDVEEDAALLFAFSADSDGSKEPPFNNFEVLDQARQEGIDFWIYLGDTVYVDTFGPEAETLDEMRTKYRQNREFEALRELLKATSTYAIWDDHEIDGNFEGQTVDPTLYTNGRRAFLEYMPVQEQDLLDDPACAGAPLFRLFHWGKNVDIIILDERSCRSAEIDEACDDDLAPTLPADIRGALGLPPEPPFGCLEAINDPSRTMLGNVQKEALKNVLLRPTATWKIIVNEVPISEIFIDPYDRWEGYAAEREELLKLIVDNDIRNVVFISGDLHANAIGDVRLNTFQKPTPVVKEIIAGPIAQRTQFESLIDIFNSEEVALAALGALTTLINPQCLNAETFGYALVGANSNSLTVILKDDEGQQIQDQLNRPDASCAITIPAQ